MFEQGGLCKDLTKKLRLHFLSHSRSHSSKFHMNNGARRPSVSSILVERKGP